MAERELAASARDPRETRRWAKDVLHRWDLADETDRTLLVLNELVTNSLVHSPGGGACRLSVDHGVLEVLVTDDGAGPPRRALRAARESPEPLEWERPGGRGLQIVVAVSQSWGIGLSDGRTGVWARWRVPAHWPHAAACVCSHAADDEAVLLASGGRVVAMPGPWEDLADADLAQA